MNIIIYFNVLVTQSASLPCKDYAKNVIASTSTDTTGCIHSANKSKLLFPLTEVLGITIVINYFEKYIYSPGISKPNPSANNVTPVIIKKQRANILNEGCVLIKLLIEFEVNDIIHLDFHAADC